MSYEGRTIYIDGEPRKIIVESGAWIHVDSPSLPGRACSQHSLSTSNLRYIFEQYGALRTSGCLYSGRGQIAPTKPALMPPRVKTPLVKRLQAAIRAFKNAK